MDLSPEVPRSRARFALTGGRNTMIRHGPSCLEGPVSRTLGQWSGKKTPAVDPKHCRENSISGEPFPHACDIRTELVERIRLAIAEDRYVTPEKWTIALELLLQHVQDGEA